MKLLRLLAWVALAEISGSLVLAQTALTPSPEATLTSPTPPAEYKLRLGDDIEFRLYYHPELNLTMTIRPDGRVAFPLIGDIPAAGRTPAEMAQSVTDGLKHQGLLNVQTTVIVRKFRDQRFYVGGEVANPGVYNLTQPLTTLQAIMQAGGLKMTAQASSIIVIRAVDPNTPLLINVNLQAKSTAGKVAGESNIPLQPLDIVFVPKSKIARMNDFVLMYLKNLNPITTVFGLNYNTGAFTFRE